MERFNGELRDGEKVMRSMKRENSPILKWIHDPCVRRDAARDTLERARQAAEEEASS